MDIKNNYSTGKDFLSSSFDKEKVIKNLQKNDFLVFQVKDKKEAFDLFFKEILPELKPNTISWGGSMTLESIGIISELKSSYKENIIITSGAELVSEQQKHENRRKALLSDLFLTGANAISEQGQIINLDAYGNRVAAMCFGPKNVVVFVSESKICTDLSICMDRVKNHTAPLNTKRLSKKTPCVKTGRCYDCSSNDRICNVWAITEKSYPKGRISIVIIEEALGF